MPENGENNEDFDIPIGEISPLVDEGEKPQVEGYYESIVSKEINLKSLVVNKVLKEFKGDEFDTAISYLFESASRKVKMKREGMLSEKQFDLLDRVLRDKENDPAYFEVFLEVLEEVSELN
jgi:hypothetical protein